jgi:hypothetical protein
VITGKRRSSSIFEVHVANNLHFTSSVDNLFITFSSFISDALKYVLSAICLESSQKKLHENKDLHSFLAFRLTKARLSEDLELFTNSTESLCLSWMRRNIPLTYGVRLEFTAADFSTPGLHKKDLSAARLDVRKQHNFGESGDGRPTIYSLLASNWCAPASELWIGNV